tara:strand:- start:1431 stop:1568 length:138 start_codon:yes stop_codon:yes gene_type:complete
MKQKKWTQQQKISQLERITSNLYIMIDKLSKEIIKIKERQQNLEN